MNKAQNAEVGIRRIKQKMLLR